MIDSLPQTTSRPIRLTQYVLCILLLVAFALRIGSITFQSLWRDEVDAICFAQLPLLQSLPETRLTFTPTCPSNIPSLLGAFSQQGFNGPLYFLMLRGWLVLAGSSELSIRFMSLGFGLIGIALIYALGKRLFNRSIGFIAAGLLAFSAYHVWYSQEAKMYTLITALALAAIYCLRRGVEDGKARYWVGVVVGTSLAMYAHILAALLIPVEVALGVLWWPLARKHLKPAAISLALLTVPYIPLALWQIPLVFMPSETGFLHYTFIDMLSTLGAAYSTGILNSVTGQPALVVAALIAATAVLGLLSQPCENCTWIRRLGLLAWAAIPFLAIYLVSINRPLFTDRYLIWIMPAFYLAVALGLYELWKWWKLLGTIGLAAMVVVGTLGIATQASTPYKSDFRSAAAAIKQSIRPDDLIVFQIPYTKYTFDYYFRQPQQSIDGPYTNYPGNNDGYQNGEESVNQMLAALLAGRRGVWLVASEVEMWDRRDLLRRWLNAHGQITQQASFAQVQIARYELANP
jgi:mannosyltransferase